jgi:hypothetical protein
MRLLTICLLLLGYTVQAQYYKTSLTTVYTWSELEQKLIETSVDWEGTLVDVDKEYIKIKKENGEVIKEWWVYYKEDGKLGDCYITETESKICVSSDYNSIFIYYKHDEELNRFLHLITLSHIVKSKPWK